MCDVAMSLSSASIYGQKLNRIRLQKFIYLLDVVGYIFEMLPPSDNHHSYKNGPYDAAIQNAVDSLAFRGVVEITGVEQLPDGKIHSQYNLTPTGLKWVESLAQEESYSLRQKAANLTGRYINDLGWSRIKNLVYAEPTYAQVGSGGFGRRLEIYNGTENTAAYLIGLINRCLESSSHNVGLNRDLAVEMFFRFLDNYDKSKNKFRITAHKENIGK